MGHSVSTVQVTRSASLVQVTATRPQVAVGTPSVVAHNALTNRSDADQHPASAITNTPAGTISATTVQAALNELDAEKQPIDADLTAIAALTTTAYGRGALTLADAPAFASYSGIPLLATTGITGTLTLTKTGTTARTATFPDAAITVAGQNIDNAFSVRQTVALAAAGATTRNLVGQITSPVTGTHYNRILQLQVIGTNNPYYHYGVNYDAATPANNYASISVGDDLAVRPLVISAAYVQVPNGTAAAPGIRLTGEASGLYRKSSAEIGVAVDGVASVGFGKPNGSSYGGGILLATPSTAEPAYHGCSLTTVWCSYGGDQGPAAGGQLRAYGSAHATKPNTVELTHGSTVKFATNATGIGFFATAPVAKPTVTGSRGANAALASLLTALAGLGLLTDSSS
jgi:hypothetical protein